jgi:hypothetical protein
MRTFIALDIDESIRARIALFINGIQGFAPDVRWVRPESLHVTPRNHRASSGWGSRRARSSPPWPQRSTP